MQISPRMMFLELVISLVFWAVVFGVPGWLLWRWRRRIGDGAISALAIGERLRRRAAGGIEKVKRRVDERAG